MKKEYLTPQADSVLLKLESVFLLSTASGNTTENIIEQAYDGDWE